MAIEAPAPSQAAVRLFAYFSRFEFALKEAGYIRADRFDGAQPDWSKFARLPAVAEVYERLKLEPGLHGLIAQPPKQQVVVDDALSWREAAAVTSAPALIDAIKRVRNNLFHGGKSGENPRDDELCVAATIALVALVDVDADLRARFLGQY